MRMLAVSLLLLAAIVFVMTRDRDNAWGYVNAAAEAAMVGAIQMALGLDAGVVVTLLPDDGSKYVSLGIFDRG